MDKQIILVGDHHGDYEGLFRKIEYCGINNCLLIHVGDGGEGFSHPLKQQRIFNILNERFKKLNIEYWSIRGNHSDPSYFTGSINLSNFKLIPDYTFVEINGEKWGFVGGAVSIDRRGRVPNMSWWEREVFVLQPKFAQKCDVLVTHSAPSWLGPFDKEGIQSYCDKDPMLWDECVKERKEIAELVRLCKPKELFCGHFHQYVSVNHDNCQGRILDILEIIAYKK